MYFISMYSLLKTLLHTLSLLIFKIIEILQCILKNCFLVVTNFIATLFIGFSIDLSNMAWFLNLAFCFLILLPSCYVSFRKSVLRSIHGFKNGSCLNSNILWFFLIVTINFKKVLIVVFVFSLLTSLGIDFLFLPIEKYHLL